MYNKTANIYVTMHQAGFTRCGTEMQLLASLQVILYTSIKLSKADIWKENYM
jgi:hypothetical protein